MFTGIIEETGSVAAIEKHGSGAKMKIAARIVTQDSREGDSIAVNGVCLTAIDIKSDGFSADVSVETLDKSTLGALKIGSVVNLERAATLSTRMGGHIVQGHVDARGRFVSAVRSGDFWTVRIRFPKEMAKYLVYKGSVAVEGISLTIADLQPDHFDIAVIPKTWELTNFSRLKPGDAVNLEADIIGKYVERIMLYGKASEKSEKPGGVTIEQLQKAGFV
jgi:riboflavin synthase